MSTNFAAVGSQIIVIPARPEHVQGMADLIRSVYEVPADEPIDDLNAATFRNHLDVFPEGQFVALDRHTNRVVGTTTNLLMNFDLANPVLAPWLETVDYG